MEAVEVAPMVSCERPETVEVPKAACPSAVIRNWVTGVEAPDWTIRLFPALVEFQIVKAEPVEVANIVVFLARISTMSLFGASPR